FESKFDHIVDITLTVYAPQSLRLQRACTRDKTDQKTILNRMNNQLSDDIKRDRSDYVIYNDDKNPLIPQVYHFLKFAKLLSSKKD
ncbi:MAG: dephospho-CoA kinase, partial [Massilibacteroides sp.]|nr:dephospho-CoA kinase [Massilibacteroides sp.]